MSVCFDFLTTHDVRAQDFRLRCDGNYFFFQSAIESVRCYPLDPTRTRYTCAKLSFCTDAMRNAKGVLEKRIYNNTKRRINEFSLSSITYSFLQSNLIEYFDD